MPPYKVRTIKVRSVFFSPECAFLEAQGKSCILFMDLLSVQRGEFGVFVLLLEHEYFVCTDAFKKWLLLPLNGKICRERAALDFVFSFGKSSLMVGGPSGGSGSDSKVSLAAHQNEAALVAHADSPMRLVEGSLRLAGLCRLCWGFML